MNLQLADKVAIVTGSSRGLGKASAWALAAEGCRVTLCARGAEALNAAAEELTRTMEKPDRVLAVAADVSTPEGAKTVLRHTVETFGRIDVLVNNVGKAGGGDLLATSDAEWQAAIDQTLFPAIRDVLVAADVDVVFLAGYMKKLGPLVLRAFAGRILNTHPALLPRFGGPGMYGDRVFEAVLEAGEAESGVSIHLVDADYDTGAIVRQCKVPVFPGDSLDDLKARVRAREKTFVVETLEQIAKGEIRLVAGAG